MIEALLLRFDAPLMSFGGPAIDQLRGTEEVPSRSMLAGLLANALGYRHSDASRTQRLQSRIRFAARRDRAGSLLVDYQTVDLGQDFLADAGWTISGVPEGRAGAFSQGTHIRTRTYLSDAIYSVAIALASPGVEPDLRDLEAALRDPARPLFIGRKCCLPSVPMLLRLAEGTSLRDVLENLPRVRARSDPGPLAAWWPTDEGDDRALGRDIPVTDDRDWVNQIHVSRRFLRHGTVDPREEGHVD